MKNVELKILIKEALKEALQEVMVDSFITRTISNPNPPHNKQQQYTQQSKSKSTQNDYSVLKEDLKKRFFDLQDNFDFTTKDIVPPEEQFRPTNISSIDGVLPPGEVSLDQISKLIRGNLNG